MSIMLSYCSFLDVCKDELTKEAIIHPCSHPWRENLDFSGFDRDYLVLHCLMRKFRPKRVIEIGTHIGVGTKIIKNAVGENSEVFSLDVPEGTGSNVHPKTSHTGMCCELSYVQLFGDSCSFDYSKYYPLDGWYIDGCHDYYHVLSESQSAVNSGARLVVYHDGDYFEVLRGAIDGLRKTDFFLWRVVGTRVLFALCPEWNLELFAGRGQ